jgi:hypothetical protein
MLFRPQAKALHQGLRDPIAEQEQMAFIKYDAPWMKTRFDPLVLHPEGHDGESLVFAGDGVPAVSCRMGFESVDDSRCLLGADLRSDQFQIGKSQGTDPEFVRHSRLGSRVEAIAVMFDVHQDPVSFFFVLGPSMMPSDQQAALVRDFVISLEEEGIREAVGG